MLASCPCLLSLSIFCVLPLVSWTFSLKIPQKVRFPLNAPGSFFVDQNCIDCDVCRWMAPSFFDRKGLQAVVKKQPESDREKLQALGAMLACPVGAIRTETSEPLIKRAASLFPAPIDRERLPNVYHLGYHAEASFAATAYLLKRRRGNLMVDCPRYNARLAAQIESMGGVHTMVLTHVDNFADHAEWKKRFPDMQRVIHIADASSTTKDCEVQLMCDGEIFEMDDDLLLMHTPGHTPGSLCVLAGTYVENETEEVRRGDNVLFSGDHIAIRPPHETKKICEGEKWILEDEDTPIDDTISDADREKERAFLIERLKRGAQFTGFKAFNRGGEKSQRIYLQRLLSDAFNFKWILPSHGRMIAFDSDEEKREMLSLAIEFFEKEDASGGQLAYHPTQEVE